MEIPLVWRQLGNSLYPGFEEAFAAGDEAIRHTLSLLNSAERTALDSYLAFLLSEACTEDDRINAWISSGASIVPPRKQLSFVLSRLRLENKGFMEER